MLIVGNNNLPENVDTTTFGALESNAGNVPSWLTSLRVYTTFG